MANKFQIGDIVRFSGTYCYIKETHYNSFTSSHYYILVDIINKGEEGPLIYSIPTQSENHWYSLRLASKKKVKTLQVLYGPFLMP